LSENAIIYYPGLANQQSYHEFYEKTGKKSSQIHLFWQFYFILYTAGEDCFLQNSFYSFKKFLQAYETRFEREYGYFCPVLQEEIEKYF
jgi:hypothetical protein